MTFRELLTKYKNGALTGEEKLLVEQELEKSEAINDYLADEIEASLIQDRERIYELSTDDNNKKNKNLERDIKKTVNRRLVSVVVASVICVFAIIMVIQYIISPIVASQFYDPTKKTAGQEYQLDLSYDLKGITEVSMPGYITSFSPIVEDLGFGKYNITFNRRDLFTKENETVDTSINKGMRSVSFLDVFPHDYFAFSEFWNNEEGSSGYQDSLEMKKYTSNLETQHMKELPSTSYISAWVRFTNDMSMEELYKLIREHKEVDFKWIAIRTAKAQGQQLMGFITDSSIDSAESVDEEKYPLFQLNSRWKFPIYEPIEVYMGELYEMHFTSLLKYLVDHKEAVGTLVGNTKNYDYESALTYIEGNGITTYGALIYGEADDLLELYESGTIMTFNIDNVIASKYIR